MSLTLLLAPSRAAALEIPRRLASIRGALTGILPLKVMDLATALAEPALLGRGLRPWDSGHGALLAARLLDEMPGGPLSERLPRTPVARVLARTFGELRRAGIPSESLAALVARVEAEEDRERLAWLARLYRGFEGAVEGRFADPATFLREAIAAMPTAVWLREAEVLIAGDLDLAPLEETFLAALARHRPMRRLAGPLPRSLHRASFAAWAQSVPIAAVTVADTALAPLATTHEPGPRLERLRLSLFEPPQGEPLDDPSVELVTAPGEAAEVRALARRILREAARGVPFEEMGVLLPRPEEYTRLITDLLSRLGIPHRLHPSLPLRYGRAGRSLLLLFRCRGLRRSEVMEFLTFAPVPFDERLGEGVVPRPAQWDVLSREAGIVSGLERWAKGVAAFIREQEQEIARATEDARRDRHRRRIEDAHALLRVVTQLDATLAELAGTATWTEWTGRLLRAFDLWIGERPGGVAERAAVRELVQALAGLGFAAGEARWDEVETVLESRLEWERTPLEPLEGGGVHVGALDALAGLPFRWVAIAGLVEGGFPGVLRPDPLLLDQEREQLAVPASIAVPPARPRRGQLSLFDEEPASPAPVAAVARLPTTQDRLFALRREFHRAVVQATERLVLSYPRADPRSGRERLPSLFFVAAASAIAARPVSADDLARLVAEDAPDALAIEETLDPSERDRGRVRTSGLEAAIAIAAGSRFFKHSHLASHARWRREFTPCDGLVAGPGVTPEIAAELDPATASRPISASRLATYAQCGFKYLLEHVLRIEPAPEPEERMRLDPLERGSLFHEVAERFLRERRDTGSLPVRDTPEERARLREMGNEALEALVAGAPPRFTVLWERERQRFHDGLLSWLAREARQSGSVPLHFEVGFGLRSPGAPGEPHSDEPLTVEIEAGRTLRVAGKIDRIDRRADGGLVIRDYKTGRAPWRDAGLFRGGKQLQIPFYVLAAAHLFPGQRVVEAFLDYVDGGRRVEFDPEIAVSEKFRETLRRITGLIAQGHFVQEPTSCEWCDFRPLCGPRRLIELRRTIKINDPRVQQYLRLKDIP